MTAALLGNVRDWGSKGAHARIGESQYLPFHSAVSADRPDPRRWDRGAGLQLNDSTFASGT